MTTETAANILAIFICLMVFWDMRHQRLELRQLDRRLRDIGDTIIYWRKRAVEAEERSRQAEEKLRQHEGPYR